MNNEIKAILDRAIFIIDNEGFTVNINDKINDYITNLQKDLANYVNVVLHDRKIIDNLQQEIQKKDAYIKYLETRVPKYKGKKFYGIEGDDEK